MNRNTTIHFEISERKIFLRIFDVLFVLAALYLTRVFFNFDYFRVFFGKFEYSITLVLYFSLFGSVFELYDLRNSSQFETTLRNIILTVLVTVLFYLLTPIYSPTLPSNRIQILFFVLAMTFGLLGWRFLYVTLFASSRFNKRILLIANGTDIESFIEILQNFDPNYRIVGVLDTATNGFLLPENIQLITLDTLDESLRKLNISEIVVASRTGKGITAELSNKLIAILESGVSVRSYRDAYEDLAKRIPVRQVETDFYNYFPFSRNNRNKLYLIVSRLADMALSILGLILGLMLLPFILIGNSIANKGPLFYTQTRVGKHRKPFKLFKFRSMIKNAEQNGAQFSYKGDIRVTKFGTFLRRSRIDEFPQFLNVLKGDMSLIGPRPERPEFVETLGKKIPFYDVRHVIKPGITGWAQVKVKYGENEDDSLEKLQYDLYYIKHRSIFLDMAILVKTLSTILFYRGQ